MTKAIPRATGAEARQQTEFIKKTESICPKCHRLTDAEIYERDGKIFIGKECPVHGAFEEVYWSDASMYKRAQSFEYIGNGIINTHKDQKSGCPYACGICDAHKSHTNLATVFVTNRCNLNCFYCFANAGSCGYVYEPSLEQIRGMFSLLRGIKPVPAKAILITGGEPTVRDDLADIIKMAGGEFNFEFIQLNTNGINIARNPSLLGKYKRAGVHNLYLSFDGVKPATNRKNHFEIPAILRAARKCKVSVTLVPTVIGGVNDRELAEIIRFALENIDVVRSVNFQPISFVGRMPESMRKKMRVTIPDVLKGIEEQTHGAIKSGDFYPVPSVAKITRIIEQATGKPEIALTAHQHCGMGTYVFKDGERVIPVSDFVNLDEFFKLVDEIERKNIKGRFGEIMAAAIIYRRIGKIVNNEKSPGQIDIKRIFIDAFLGRSEGSYEFHNKALFIGTMHFQDAYNFDVARVKRCVIHYPTPDGRLIPFCAFNGLPEIYRDAIHKKFSVPAHEWEKKTGKKL